MSPRGSTSRGHEYRYYVCTDVAQAIRGHRLHVAERDHQGVGGQLIALPANHNRADRSCARKDLGGLLRFYPREAA